MGVELPLRAYKDDEDEEELNEESESALDDESLDGQAL